VRRELAIAGSQVIVSGSAPGREGKAAKVNKLRTEREPAADQQSLARLQPARACFSRGLTSHPVVFCATGREFRA
jgi:hypothetical protein